MRVARLSTCGLAMPPQVAAAVEAAHAPFGAGAAHADPDVALLDWYYLLAMPLRVRGVQAAGEVCPPRQSFFDRACARYTAPVVARGSACLRERVQVWLCDGDARCHEPEDADQAVPVTAAAEAQAGVYVVFALPLDLLQLPVFWAHWLGSICCFDVGVRHPALT